MFYTQVLINQQHLGLRPSLVQLNEAKKAEPFFVHPEIADLLLAAIPTFPSCCPNDCQMPSSHGFAWLGKPMEFAAPGLGIKGFGFFWWPSGGATILIWVGEITTAKGTEILLDANVWNNDMDWSIWLDVKHNQTGVPIQSVHAWARESRRFALAFWQFTQERLCKTASHQPNRNTSRRWVKAADLPPPLIKVIVLRAVDYLPQSNASPVEIDWACRWIVRSHWRRQWIPSRNRYEPRLIASYIKGPQDKPLKASAVTLFNVKR